MVTEKQLACAQRRIFLPSGLSRLALMARGKNRLLDHPRHSLTYGVQSFTDTLIEDWRAHFGDWTAKSVLSVSKSKLHINILELKESLSTCVLARPF